MGATPTVVVPLSVPAVRAWKIPTLVFLNSSFARLRNAFSCHGCLAGFKGVRFAQR